MNKKPRMVFYYSHDRRLLGSRRWSRVYSRHKNGGMLTLTKPPCRKLAQEAGFVAEFRE